MNNLLIRRLLAATISLAIFGNSLQSHAEEFVCCGGGTVFAFFNGVLTSESAAADILTKLEEIHGETDPSGQPIHYV